jgi:TetR/AcrR family transcriptional regulator, regulator of cefoperazone and chloramphenicol sensitivity
MSAPHPKHRQNAGYACGAETRRRIIEAAIRLFGERGFEGASTREIGRLAGINAPALRYYFDSKEGLYQACAEHLASQTEALLAPALQAGREALAALHPAAELTERFLAIMDATADMMLAVDEGSSRRMFLAQEQAGHGPDGTFSPAMQAFRESLGQVVTGLIARITGRPVDDAQTRIRVMSLFGQLMVFHVVQRSVLLSMGWDRIDETRLHLIKSTLRSQAKTLIDAWRHEDGDAHP